MMFKGSLLMASALYQSSIIYACHRATDTNISNTIKRWQRSQQLITVAPKM